MAGKAYRGAARLVEVGPGKAGTAMHVELAHGDFRCGRKGKFRRVQVRLIENWYGRNGVLV